MLLRVLFFQLGKYSWPVKEYILFTEPALDSLVQGCCLGKTMGLEAASGGIGGLCTSGGISAAGVDLVGTK